MLKGRKLSQFVEKDYRVEMDLIRDAGSLRMQFLRVGFFMMIVLLTWYFMGAHLGANLLSAAFLLFCGLPCVLREWERRKVSEEMRYHREVRIDMKLNALLGIINLHEDEEATNHE